MNAAELRAARPVPSTRRPDHAVSVPPEPIAAGPLEIHAVPDAGDNLVWLVVDAASGEAAIVDGPGGGEILDYCAARGITPTAIWITHTHGDHVGVARDLAGALPVVGNRDRAGDIPGLTHPVAAGDTVELGATRAVVLSTPGHLDGHLSYWIAGEPGALFCGDTLFAGGCGRLFDGPPAAMLDSLLRLAQLPPDTLVCCAHEYTWDNLRFAWSVEPGSAALRQRIAHARALRADGRTTLPSTIGVERATNPFLRVGSPEIQARFPGDPLATFTALRAAKDAGAYRAIPDDAMGA